MAMKLVGHRAAVAHALYTSTSTGPSESTPSKASRTDLGSEQSMRMANTWPLASQAISSANLDSLAARKYTLSEHFSSNKNQLEATEI